MPRLRALTTRDTGVAFDALAQAAGPARWRRASARTGSGDRQRPPEAQVRLGSAAVCDVVGPIGPGGGHPDDPVPVDLPTGLPPVPTPVTDVGGSAVSWHRYLRCHPHVWFSLNENGGRSRYRSVGNWPGDSLVASL